MQILLVDERAEEYRAFCSDINHSIHFYTEPPPRSLIQHTVIDILVASPAMASATLKLGCRPKWIQSTWAGVDSLIATLGDAELALGDITLTGIKGIFGQLMSEYVFAYILNDLRDLEHFQKLQNQNQWNDDKLPGTLANKTIAIIGTGSIGQQLAATAAHFGMKATGVNRSGNTAPNFSRVLTDLAHATSDADYVIGCLPATSNTDRVFDAAFFANLSKRSMFFNVGRGTSVNESALIKALNNKQLRCAVIDVFRHEPLASSHVLWKTKNLKVTPHISAPSTPQDVSEIFLDNLNRFNQSQPLLHVIDPNLGY